jgi:hypothetical protein
MHRALTLLTISTLLMFGAGCSAVPATMLPPSLLQPSTPQKDLLSLQPPAAGNQFEAVAKAQQQNAVVLQIVGSETPSRIIPLPAGGQTVRVSDLLRQSGISDEMSRIRATLYRNSTDAMSGVRMGIRFQGQSCQVLPEYDYTLRPGDRLEVAELELNPWKLLTSMFSASPGRRAYITY